MTEPKLYSYRYVCGGKDVIAEGLKDHSARVVKHLMRARNSSLARYAAIKGGVKEEGFVNSLLIAGALHDVGKAFYQHNWREDSKGCRYLSFAGHEWVSAYFIELMRRELSGDESPAAGMLDVTLYATLLHHHAMDVRGRVRGLPGPSKPLPKEGVVKGLIELSGLIPDDVVREAYVKVVRRATNHILSRPHTYVADMVEVVRNAYIDILKRSAGRRGRRALYLLGVASLVTADYLAASEVRGPSSSRFWGVIKEFSSIYFSVGR